MKADAHPLKTLFGKDARYVVPLYQRPYVWTQEDKWEPLLEDILLVVRDTLLGIEVAPHFLGAIVLDYQFGAVADLEVRHIVDGQQRLTTLQIILGAAVEVADRHDCDRAARLLRKLTSNNPDLVAEPDQEFKVWPTNVDRLAYRAVMRRQVTPDLTSSLLVKAHGFFVDALEVWVSELTVSVDDGLDTFTRAVRDYLRLVVIDLEKDDDAQAIFESLNAHTTPLLAIDMVKNLVFRRAESEGADLEALYFRNWQPFDEDPWRRQIRQGRLYRPRAEIFLMHWLTMKRGDDTSARHLYPVFRRLMEGRTGISVEQMVAEFAGDASVYDSFDQQPLGSRARLFFERLAVLDVSTIYPLLLFLFRQSPEVLPAWRRDRALEVLESWLVRRMLCRFTIKSYNRYFLDLLQAVQRSPERSDEVLRDELISASGDSNRWPDDEQLQGTLEQRSLYYSVRGDKIVMVLRAVELAKRALDAKAEGSQPPGRSHYRARATSEVARALADR